MSNENNYKCGYAREEGKERRDSATIRNYWNDMARKSNLLERAGSQDENQGYLEINKVISVLQNIKNIKDIEALEIGCGDGKTSTIFAKYIKRTVAIDYSAEMINRAKKCISVDNLTFRVEDVQKLTFPSGSFDLVISIRCLINLPTWEGQMEAIKDINRVLRKDGVFIMIEGSQQGRRNLNKYRSSFNLGEMPRVWYNLDFDEDKLLPFLNQYFEILEKENWGMYDFISRIIHPLLVKPNEPSHNSKINEVAKTISLKIPEFNDIGRVISLILKKLDT